MNVEGLWQAFRSLIAICSAALLMGLPATALALEYDLGDTQIRWVNRVTLGSAIRVQGRDPDLIGIVNGGNAYSTNGDDGDLAFSKGDLISAAFKYTPDLTISYGDFGAFIRSTYRFDLVNDTHDFFNDRYYQGPPAYTQDNADLHRKRSQVHDEIGSNFQLLDAYLFGNFDVLGHSVDFKLGRVLLNWGESLLVQNGLNSILAANANNLRVPGFDLTEVFTPSAMALVSFDVTDNSSLQLFYQLQWEKTKIDASGSYFGTNDFAGIGGTEAEVGFGRCPENSAPGTCAFAAGGSAIPRKRDVDPSDKGQFGAALHWIVPQLGDTDIGFYAAKYHSRLPVISGHAALTPGVPGSGDYFREYPENIKLYGISFNNSVDLPLIGNVALQGEYSYKQDQPIQIDDVELFIAGLRVGLPSQVGNYGPGQYIRGYRRVNVSQLDLSLTKVIGPLRYIGSDQLILALEAAGDYVHDMPGKSKLRFDGPGTYQPADPTVAAATGVPVQPGGYADQTSWGYRLLARFRYTEVMPGIELEPTFVFGQDVHGTSPTPILNFVDGRKQLTAELVAHIHQVWEAGLGYTNYFGGGTYNLLRDRDYVSFYVGYNF